MSHGRPQDVGVNGTTLLGKDYWLVFSTPGRDTTVDGIDKAVDEHVAWMLNLERDGRILFSGPLVSGPDTGPGSGITVFRAPDEDAARALASQDPFVRAGLRTFAVYRWRLNEGSVGLRLSLGAATYDWE